MQATECKASDRKLRPGLIHFKYHGFLNIKERFPVELDVSPGQEEQPIYWFLVTNITCFSAQLLGKQLLHSIAINYL